MPTREETEEIEFSSRFYTDAATVFMTATLLTGVTKGEPVNAPLTMAIGTGRIVTLRYEEFRALQQFISLARKPGNRCDSVEAVFNMMIESVVDRAADVIEQIGVSVDRLNNEIFPRDRKKKRDRKLEQVISDVGFQDDLAAKIRLSLQSLERLVRSRRWLCRTASIEEQIADTSNWPAAISNPWKRTSRSCRTRYLSCSTQHWG